MNDNIWQAHVQTEEIEAAQSELISVLDKINVPEDMSDWTADDWTIFALHFLTANIDDALEGYDE